MKTGQKSICEKVKNFKIAKSNVYS